MPAAINIPLDFQNIGFGDKVTKALWDLEINYPMAGLSTYPTNFPGELRKNEERAATLQRNDMTNGRKMASEKSLYFLLQNGLEIVTTISVNMRTCTPEIAR